MTIAHPGAGKGGTGLTAFHPATISRSLPGTRSTARPADWGIEARWESGYPEDCKSLHAGSIPARASSARPDLFHAPNALTGPSGGLAIPGWTGRRHAATGHRGLARTFSGIAGFLGGTVSGRGVKSAPRSRSARAGPQGPSLRTLSML